jgi:hypothetical protein
MSLQATILEWESANPTIIVAPASLEGYGVHRSL